MRERLKRGGVIVSEITDAAISLIPEKEASERIDTVNVNVANDTTLSAAPEKKKKEKTISDSERRNNNTPPRSPQEIYFNSKQTNNFFFGLLPTTIEGIHGDVTAMHIPSNVTFIVHKRLGPDLQDIKRLHY